MNLKKSTYWVFCNECNESKKILSLELTKDNELFIVPECQHKARKFKLEEL